MTTLEEVAVELRSMRAELRAMRDGLAPARAVTMSQAARQLSVSLTTIKRLVRDRKLSTITMGRRRLVPQTEIDALATPTKAAPRGGGRPKQRTGMTADELRRRVRALTSQ